MYGVRRLAPALVALALTASAALAEPPSAAPFEVVAPRAGETLIAGSRARLEWAPRAGLERRGIEEWEAFLSLDGGESFPFRLTPHLDLDRNSVDFRVPEVPTADARLLFRFGDEREETGYLVPHGFAIALGPVSLPAPSEWSAARGEAARPGDRGVVSWVEGGRRGGGRLVAVRAVPPPRAVDARHRHGDVEPAETETSSEVSPLAPGTTGLVVPPASLRPRPTSAGVHVGVDPLLLTGRRNE
jgi:hypothetical protein